MNSTGAISLGGTTAGQSIELENGGPGTAQISLNDAAVRTLAGVPGSGTTIIMPTNFYGKSNRVTLNLTIAASTQNYDVYSNAAPSPSYSAGKTDVIVTVNPAVVVGSASTGSYAMLVPSSFNPGDTVTIVNNGYIVGTGGGGGRGGTSQFPVPLPPATPGSPGGNSIYVNRPTTITNNSTIGAGGGGGGGGGGTYLKGPQSYSGGGGGGGAGNTVGAGAAGGTQPGAGGTGGTGSPGTLTTGGGGGGGGATPVGSSGAGGTGGGLGASGSPGANSSNGVAAGSGGGTGNYITGNPFVTWPATGNRYGGVA